jgi:hypothetical protein
VVVVLPQSYSALDWICVTSPPSSSQVAGGSFQLDYLENLAFWVLGFAQQSRVFVSFSLNIALEIGRGATTAIWLRV